MNASSDSFSAKTYPLRVLYISHEGGMYGAQQSLLLLLKQLPPKTVHAEVSLARPGPLEEELAKLPHVSVSHHQRLQWVKHSKRNLFQAAGDIMSLCWNALFRVPKLAKHIKEQRIELVHTNSLVSIEGPLAAALAGVPHVWHIREMPSIPNPRFQPIFPMWLVRWICQTLVTQFSGHLLCISQAVRNQFTCSDEFASVTYNPFVMPTSTTVPPNKAPEDRTDVGYVGRISPGKGIVALIDAIDLLNKQRCDSPVTLHCFGKFVDTAAEVQIRQKVNKLALEDHVIFHGFSKDKTAIYAQMDVLALPSTNEAFGRVLIEAMAYGLPCIGSNAAAIPEVVGPILDDTYLFEPDNASDIAETINYALMDTNRPTSEALRKYCERFSLQHHCTNVLALYKHLISLGDS